MSKGYTPKEYYDFEALSTLKEVKGKGVQHRYTHDGIEETDTSCVLTHSLLTSPAYKDLTPRQRQLYVVAKDLFFGARTRPAKDFPEVDAFKWLDGKGCFYLNFKLLTEVYALYKPKDTKGVYADIKALQEHGFIKRIGYHNGTRYVQDTDTDGKNTRAIYKYSDKWKTWKPTK